MATNTAAFDLDGTDTIMAALFNNAITPDRNVSAALSAYNAGQWATANEVHDAGQWDQGGIALTSPTINSGSPGVVFFDAADVESGAAAELANVYGVYVYDGSLTLPVADQGICYNYLGGQNGIAGGTFRVVWAANGIWRITL
ncbi:hypothetical protein ACU635_50600 [[Actinomadura] parvosata]|uniref:hypothetical protein n=1 Tax=[Actinomadura] parvosata TaxID=1955412 RepID=UPI00406D0A59